MNVIERAISALGLRSVDSTDTAPPPTAPAREAGDWISSERAIRIGTVFSCVAILSTAAEQISIDADRNSTPIESAFVERPDRAMTRERWIHQLVVSLALHGNAYLKVIRDSSNQPLAAIVVDPTRVSPFRDKDGNVRYSYGTSTYKPGEIVQLAYLLPPGALLGLGPIQAAQSDLRGHHDLNAAGHDWFNTSGTPSGVISTAADLTPTQAAGLMDAWNNVPAGRTRLLTHGATYQGVTLSPKDAQFLESRRFSKTEIADLFGIPASLLLGVEAGSSQTYSNIEQDWTGFVRFRLMRYLSEIEQALTRILPRGQRARFNIEALLRTDSRTRMEIHKTAIEAGIYTPAYARTIEHLPEQAAL